MPAYHTASGFADLLNQAIYASNLASTGPVNIDADGPEWIVRLGNTGIYVGANDIQKADITGNCRHTPGFYVHAIVSTEGSRDEPPDAEDIEIITTQDPIAACSAALAAVVEDRIRVSLGAELLAQDLNEPAPPRHAAPAALAPPVTTSAANGELIDLAAYRTSRLAAASETSGPHHDPG